MLLVTAAQLLLHMLHSQKDYQICLLKASTVSTCRKCCAKYWIKVIQLITFKWKKSLLGKTLINKTCHLPLFLAGQSLWYRVPCSVTCGDQGPVSPDERWWSVWNPVCTSRWHHGPSRHLHHPDQSCLCKGSHGNVRWSADWWFSCWTSSIHNVYISYITVDVHICNCSLFNQWIDGLSVQKATIQHCN